MGKKFIQIILLCVSGLANADTGHDLEAGIVHIRGDMVNGTCEVDSYNKGMYVELFTLKFSGELTSQKKDPHKLFYLNFSSCPYFLYNNLTVSFTSPPGLVQQSPNNYYDWVGNKLPFNSIKETVNQNFPIPFSNFVNNDDKVNLYFYVPQASVSNKETNNRLMIANVYYP